jgi:hypothetical protein
VKHRVIHTVHVTPILASKNPRIGWGVIGGFIAAAALLLAIALADGVIAPFFTTVIGGAR